MGGLVANLLPKVLPKILASLPLDFTESARFWELSHLGLEFRKNLPGGSHRPRRPPDAASAASPWPPEQGRAGQEGRRQRCNLPSPYAAAVRGGPDRRGAGDGRPAQGRPRRAGHGGRSARPVHPRELRAVREGGGEAPVRARLPPGGRGL